MERTKMVLKNCEAHAHFTRLAELEKDTTPFPAIAGYRIAQNVAVLRAALKPYQTTIDQIFKKYANGKTTIERSTDPESYAAATKEIHDLDNLEIEIEIYKFPFNLVAQMNFPLSVFSALEFMMYEEE